MRADCGIAGLRSFRLRSIQIQLPISIRTVRSWVLISGFVHVEMGLMRVFDYGGKGCGDLM